MYGMNVHNAVIAAKEKETGVTIHRVNAEYDSGEIVAQTVMKVNEDDMNLQKAYEKGYSFFDQGENPEA